MPFRQNLLTHPLANGIVNGMRLNSRFAILPHPARQCLCLLLALAVAWSGLPPLLQPGAGRQEDRRELRQIIHALQALEGKDRSVETSLATLITSLRVLTGQRSLIATPAPQKAKKAFVLVRSDQIAPPGAIALPAVMVTWTLPAEQAAPLVTADIDIPTPPPRQAA